MVRGAVAESERQREIRTNERTPPTQLAAASVIELGLSCQQVTTSQPQSTANVAGQKSVYK